MNTLALPTVGNFKVEPDEDVLDASSKTHHAAKTIMLRIHKLFESLEMKDYIDFDYNFGHSETKEEVIIKITCQKSNFCVFDANEHSGMKTEYQDDTDFNNLPLEIKIEKVELDSNDYKYCHPEIMTITSHQVDIATRYYEESEENSFEKLKKSKGPNKSTKQQKRAVRNPMAESDDEIDQNHKCRQCGKFYKNRKSLMNHVRYHLEDKSVECEVCGFKAADKWKLKRHMNSHAVDRKFKCDMCEKSYLYSYNLTDHQKRVHPEGESVTAGEIAVCNEDEMPAMRFRSKFRYVDGVKIYECEICGKGDFLDRKILMHHRQDHRETDLGSNFMCHMCSYTTKSRESLRSHINNVHKEKRLCCDICDARYRNKTELKAHMDAIHLMKRDYFCHICGKSYSRLRTLQKHLNYHTAEKKIVCEICGFKAVESGRMNRHMKSHTGIRNYSCDLCGKMFLYSYNVNLHKKLVHFGEKQKAPSEERLTCHICCKRFPQIRKVQEHLRVFHGVLDDASTND